MITFHLPGQKSIDASDLSHCSDLVARSVWIELVEPTREEESAIEQSLGIDVPTREELQKIDLSRRLYREKDQVFMTATVLTKSDFSHPESSAITFILGPEKLTTVRYANPVAFTAFRGRWESSGAEFSNGFKTLVGLLEAMVERLADILEHAGSSLDRLSLEVLGNGAPEGAHAKPAQRDFKDILGRIGRASDLSSRARESLVSLSRLIAFLQGAVKEQPSSQEDWMHLKAIAGDVAAMSDHASFLSGKVSFLLDATLGLINNEQNSIIKIVSVAAVVFLPPTLVASIYGMNFDFMPELKWRLGYPFAIGLMIISAILPYALFKRKGWL